MGQAKRRGTFEQRQAMAFETMEQQLQAQKAQEHERKKAERQAEIDLYRRQCAELGEDEAVRRAQARKDARHQHRVQMATLLGTLAGAFMPPRRRPEPESLQDFLDNPSAFLGDH